MNGNHLRAIVSSRFPHVMLSRISENSASTAVCTRFGRACILPAIQIIVPHVRIPAITRYITALLMSNGPGSSTQVSSLNSFCGLELLVVLPREAEDHQDRDDREDVEAEDSEQDLAPGRHGRGDFLSRGRTMSEVAK